MRIFLQLCTTRVLLTLGVGLAQLLPVVRADQTPGLPAGSGRLDLPVAEVVDKYPPYEDFCRRHPRQCDLGGAMVLVHSPALMQQLAVVNAAVNREIRFVTDIAQYNAEEYWALPMAGRGDCEDKALEKRRRLVAQGLAPGAMRMALVFHRSLLTSHGILTVETSAGTFVLDSSDDEVRRWDRLPYNFEARERPDGRWERFDQSHWTYQH